MTFTPGYETRPFDKVLSALGDRVVTASETDATARCPAHDDRNPSLSLGSGQNGEALLCCHAGCSAAEILSSLGLAMKDLFPTDGERDVARLQQAITRPRQRSTWSADCAKTVCQVGLSRTRNDEAIDADAAAYEYLKSRGLSPAWEQNLYGILHPELVSELPRVVRHWPKRGYRIVAPLYDQQGEVSEVQARSIDPKAEIRTLLPKGGSAKGKVFACSQGRALLRNESTSSIVILGEGLTDYLALSISAPIPVFSTAGVGTAANCVGPWAKERTVILALDCDQAGEKGTVDAAQVIKERGGRAQRLRWPREANDACELVERFGVDDLAQFLAGIANAAEGRTT